MEARTSLVPAAGPRYSEASAGTSQTPRCCRSGHTQMFYLPFLEYRLYGVIQDVVFTHQPHFSCSFLSLICLSTNQNIQLIHSLLIRIEWTTGNGILMSSSHWPIYNKFSPAMSPRAVGDGSDARSLTVTPGLTTRHWHTPGHGSRGAVSFSS